MDEFKKQHTRKLGGINDRKSKSLVGKTNNGTNGRRILPSEMQNDGRNSRINSRVLESEKNAEITLPQKQEHGFSQTNKLNLEFVLFVGKKGTILENEKYMLVYHKESVKKLRKEFPGIAMYSILEMRELLKHDDGSDKYKEFLRKIHFIKKTFGGWIKIN